jgi:hypothetical protein
MIGISVELFGFINLFGDFFPVVLGFLRQLPFIGPMLRAPYIAPVPSPPSFLEDQRVDGVRCWID